MLGKIKEIDNYCGCEPNECKKQRSQRKAFGTQDERNTVALVPSSMSTPFSFPRLEISVQSIFPAPVLSQTEIEC